jgi:hypothetical protein
MLASLFDMGNHGQKWAIIWAILKSRIAHMILPSNRLYFYPQIGIEIVNAPTFKYGSGVTVKQKEQTK